MAESFTFTVGKLDAGMAILIGERAHLIEFPSLLLPPGVSSGSIVNIAVHRNTAEEKRQRGEFWDLQRDILDAYGKDVPQAPELRVRNITQTSVALEWSNLELATAKLRSLDLYRNGQRLSTIPSPFTNTSIRSSSLEVNTEYSFQLILRTTAGTYPSNLIRVRTHTIFDTSGISVCFGQIDDPKMLEYAKQALSDMRAKWSDKIQIETTHFVCSSPAVTPGGAQAAGNSTGALGVEYQRALQLSIPVVQPHWVIACLTEKKMVPISGYYLGITPRPVSQQFSDSMSLKSQSPPTDRKSTPTPEVPLHNNSNNANTNPESARSSSSSSESPEPVTPRSRRRNGTMNKNFKFPPVPIPVPPESQAKPRPSTNEGDSAVATRATADDVRGTSVTPQPRVHVQPPSVEIPPPTPVEKDSRRDPRSLDTDSTEELGETVEVDLT
ncbi:hypothetical protein BOTBODRAFT_108457 [Botryobasidium botryosum FD-172 SS1]|uniref:Fibronectin type-III domain-containing protein n=1 Tax=Botryobasidium botryosum (strain FD-172 SS1) TaxID=930990 RepID=A0A067MIX2_BOTB1|nr:hypothetical protein BOTBODRAFT_108457 [Botryobasidium botryosum FD-172 SS1]